MKRLSSSFSGFLCFFLASGGRTDLRGLTWDDAVATDADGSITVSGILRLTGLWSVTSSAGVLAGSASRLRFFAFFLFFLLEVVSGAFDEEGAGAAGLPLPFAAKMSSISEAGMDVVLIVSKRRCKEQMIRY